jgi:predicted nucleotidyltransferase
MLMCENLKTAQTLSETKLQELQKELTNAFNEKDFDKSFLDNICVYTCGSLARNEFVEISDLDLFFINNSHKEFSQLYKQLFFQKLYEINKQLGYKAPSKFGQFWDFTSKENLLDIGSQMEDCNNSLTARLLLILESKPIFNGELYNIIVEEVIEKYFVDYAEHEHNFVPMFLINDIFRYWYTLTLNYEFRRDSNDTENDKCWKRLKLKYARLLTCFSFIVCLFEKNITPEKVFEIIKKSPLERLENIAEKNNGFSNIVSDIKVKYNWFLSLKQEQPSWWDNKTNKSSAFTKAEEFHNDVAHTLMEKIYQMNSSLRDKLDF